MSLSISQPVHFWDIGSQYGRLYTTQKGLEITDASYIARRVDTKDIVSLGQEALDLNERTPAHIEVKCVVEKGVIADEYLYSYLVSQWNQRGAQAPLTSFFSLPTAVVGIPFSTDPTHARATSRAYNRAGYGEVVLIPHAYAVLAFHDIQMLGRSSVVFDLGAGKSEITCMNNGGIEVSKCLTIAGNVLDEKIQHWVDRMYGVSISQHDARNIKHMLSLVKTKKKENLRLRGKDKKNNVLTTVSIKNDEIIPVIEEYLQMLCDQWWDMKHALRGGVFQNVHTSGIVLCGGLSKLHGIDSWLQDKLQMPVACVARPEVACNLGLARLYSNWDAYSYMRMRTHA